MHRREDFHHKVKTACREQPGGGLVYNFSKVIVVGDLAVGKTCLINRLCKDVFDSNYTATMGVDLEMEDFQVLGVPFRLQLWDTSGHEKYKCITYSYHGGAQVLIIAFAVNDIGSLSHVRQWLEESLEHNDAGAIQLFLVGTKKDLSSPAQYSQVERDALKLAREIGAEYWAVSSLTGENVGEFFSRVASLGFENCVLAELGEEGSATEKKKKKKSSCCQS